MALQAEEQMAFFNKSRTRAILDEVEARVSDPTQKDGATYTEDVFLPRKLAALKEMAGSGASPDDLMAWAKKELPAPYRPTDWEHKRRVWEYATVEGNAARLQNKALDYLKRLYGMSSKDAWEKTRTAESAAQVISDTENALERYAADNSFELGAESAIRGFMGPAIVKAWESLGDLTAPQAQMKAREVQRAFMQEAMMYRQKRLSDAGWMGTIEEIFADVIPSLPRQLGAQVAGALVGGTLGGGAAMGLVSAADAKVLGAPQHQIRREAMKGAVLGVFGSLGERGVIAASMKLKGAMPSLMARFLGTGAVSVASEYGVAKATGEEYTLKDAVSSFLLEGAFSSAETSPQAQRNAAWKAYSSGEEAKILDNRAASAAKMIEQAAGRPLTEQEFFGFYDAQSKVKSGRFRAEIMGNLATQIANERVAQQEAAQRLVDARAKFMAEREQRRQAERRGFGSLDEEAVANIGMQEGVPLETGGTALPMSEEELSQRLAAGTEQFEVEAAPAREAARQERARQLRAERGTEGPEYRAAEYRKALEEQFRAEREEERRMLDEAKKARVSAKAQQTLERMVDRAARLREQMLEAAGFEGEALPPPTTPPAPAVAGEAPQGGVPPSGVTEADIEARVAGEGEPSGWVPPQGADDMGETTTPTAPQAAPAVAPTPPPAAPDKGIGGKNRSPNEKAIRAAIEDVGEARTARMDIDWASESRRQPQNGKANEISTSEESGTIMGNGPREKLSYKARRFNAYDESGNLVGTMSIIVEGYAPGAFKIAVRPDAMRRGYGMKLLDAAEASGIDMLKAMRKNSFSNEGRSLARSWLLKKLGKAEAPPTAPPPAAPAEGQGKYDLMKDGIEGEAIDYRRVQNGNEYFEYAIGRVEKGAPLEVFRRSISNRGSYGGWRWETDVSKLRPAAPAAAPPTATTAPTAAAAGLGRGEGAARPGVPGPGQRLLDGINEALARGETVYVRTSSRATIITPETAAKWKARGLKLFKLTKQGDLLMARGKKYNRIGSGGQYGMLVSTQTLDDVTKPESAYATPATQAAPPAAPPPPVPPAPARGMGGARRGKKAAPPASAPEGRPAPVAAVAGARSQVPVQGGAAQDVRYAVMEMADIKPSNDPTAMFAATPGYPTENRLQERDYANDPAEQGKVRANAASLRPDEIINTAPSATTGPSIVTPDGTVINGNSRAMSLKLAAASGNTAEYRRVLIERASQFGIDPESIKGMREPVLVRVVDMDPRSEAAAVFGRQGNITATQAVSPTKRAGRYVRLIDDEILDAINAAPDSTISEILNNPQVSRPFREALIRSLPPSEVPEFFNADKSFTVAGQELAQNILLMKAIPQEVVERMSPELRRTVSQSVPQLAQMVRTEGMREASDAFVNALDVLIGPMRNGAISPEVLMGQDQMFGEKPQLSGIERMMLDFVYRERGASRRMRDRLAALITSQEQAGLMPEPLNEMMARSLEVEERPMDGERMSVGRSSAAASDARHAELETRFKEGDAKAGDEARKMVEDAAQKAGYTIRAYHGTDAGPFAQFDRNLSGSGTATEGDWMFHFSSDIDQARVYGSRVVDAFLDINPETAIIIDISDKKSADWNKYGLPDPEPGATGTNYYDENMDVFSDLMDMNGGEYSDIIIKDSSRTHYVVSAESSIKSADPFTYRDDGSLIPLSERFDVGDPDIRFSRGEGATPPGGTEGAMPPSDPGLQSARAWAEQNLVPHLRAKPKSLRERFGPNPTAEQRAQHRREMVAWKRGAADLRDQLVDKITKDQAEAETVDTVRTGTKVDRLVQDLKSGKITREEFDRRVSEQMDAEMARREVDRARKATGTRIRGYDRVMEVLHAASRKGEITPEMVDIAGWLLSQNPELAGDLAVRVIERGAADGNRRYLGKYNTAQRLVTLFKGIGDEQTVAHEILHHLERFMPAPMRAAIRAEYLAQLNKAVKAANGDLARARGSGNEEAATRASNLVRFLDSISQYHQGESVLGLDKAAWMMASGLVDIKMYRLTQPSEFWAEDGSRILNSRYGASGIWARIRQWMTEFAQKVKSVFGGRSDAPVIRAMDYILKQSGAVETTRYGLGGRARTGDIYASRARAERQGLGAERFSVAAGGVPPEAGGGDSPVEGGEAPEGPGPGPGLGATRVPARSGPPAGSARMFLQDTLGESGGALRGKGGGLGDRIYEKIKMGVARGREIRAGFSEIASKVTRQIAGKRVERTTQQAFEHDGSFYYRWNAMMKGLLDPKGVAEENLRNVAVETSARMWNEAAMRLGTRLGVDGEEIMKTLKRGRTLPHDFHDYLLDVMMDVNHPDRQVVAQYIADATNKAIAKGEIPPRKAKKSGAPDDLPLLDEDGVDGGDGEAELEGAGGEDGLVTAGDALAYFAEVANQLSPTRPVTGAEGHLASEFSREWRVPDLIPSNMVARKSYRHYGSGGFVPLQKPALGQRLLTLIDRTARIVGAQIEFGRGAKGWEGLLTAEQKAALEAVQGSLIPTYEPVTATDKDRETMIGSMSVAWINDNMDELIGANIVPSLRKRYIKAEGGLEQAGQDFDGAMRTAFGRPYWGGRGRLPLTTFAGKVGRTYDAAANLTRSIDLLSASTLNAIEALVGPSVSESVQGAPPLMNLPMGALRSAAAFPGSLTDALSEVAFGVPLTPKGRALVAAGEVPPYMSDRSKSIYDRLFARGLTRVSNAFRFLNSVAARMQSYQSARTNPITGDMKKFLAKWTGKNAFNTELMAMQIAQRAGVDLDQARAFVRGEMVDGDQADRIWRMARSRSASITAGEGIEVSESSKFAQLPFIQRLFTFWRWHDNYVRRNAQQLRLGASAALSGGIGRRFAGASRIGNTVLMASINAVIAKIAYLYWFGDDDDVEREWRDFEENPYTYFSSMLMTQLLAGPLGTLIRTAGSDVVSSAAFLPGRIKKKGDAVVNIVQGMAEQAMNEPEGEARFLKGLEDFTGATKAWTGGEGGRELERLMREQRRRERGGMGLQGMPPMPGFGPR